MGRITPWAIAVTVGLVSGVYAFNEPLKHASNDLRSQRYSKTDNVKTADEVKPDN